MTSYVFANNVNTQLASAISSSATTITLASSANLPSSIPASTYFVMTLNDQATRQVYEVVYATAISGSSLTVIRGQEGTSAVGWGVGDYAFSGVTAGQMASFDAVAGVTSFNARTGAVALSSSDVGTALGYTAANDADVVHTSSNETIAGIKTFSNNLVASANITSSATITGATVETTGNVIVTAPSGATPNKFIRSDGVNLQIANSANSAYIFTLSDAGDLYVPSSITAPSITASGSNFIGGPVYAVLATSATGGNVYLRPNGGSSATGQFIIGTSGNVLATGIITPGSDERIKTNVQPIVGALDVVRTALVGVEYDRVDQDGKHDAGFIAQRVKEHLPHLVPITETHGFSDFHSMNYNGAVAYLSAAITELHDIVKAQQASINAPLEKDG